MAAFSTPRGMLSMLVAFIAMLQITNAIHHVSPSPEQVVRRIEAINAVKRDTRIAVKGVQGVAASRLEIRQLAKNADQFNLYLLAMERYQAKDHNDQMSYFAITAIHGVPYQSWGGFGNLVNQAGFCTHDMTLFGTWHRAYLALFEQGLYQSAQEVVNSFPSGQQQRWKNALNGFRLAYWDWALQEGDPVPQQFRDQYVSVTKPSGQVTIPNPLYTFNFGQAMLPAAAGLPSPWNKSPTTIRFPDSNGNSDNTGMNNAFGEIRASLANRIYGLFISGISWGYVVTEAIGARTSTNGNNPDSFESIHDAIHSTTGGHMAYLDWSALDPIFMHHHCQVDRLITMYQLVQPDTYVANGPVPHPMAQWNTGEEKNSNSPLKPITKNTNGDYYTSNDIKDTLVLGYYYPETGHSASSQSVQQTVASMYGPNQGKSQSQGGSRGQAQVQSVGDSNDSGKKSSSKSGKSGKSATASVSSVGQPLKQGDYWHVVSVQANKYQMDGSYTVHCYLGGDNTTSAANTTHPSVPHPMKNSTAPIHHNSTAPAKNSTVNTSSPNYVGGCSIAGKSVPGKETNIVGGCVPMTAALQHHVDQGKLKSLHPNDVEPYLAANLHYKVVGPHGEIPANQVPNLHIYAKGSPVNAPSGNSTLPSLGSYQVMPGATANKPAGQPFTYTPSPLDNITPGPGEPASAIPHGQPSGTSPSSPMGTMSFPGGFAPSSDQGYCVSKQVIKYVDPSGKFLYSS